MKTIVYMIVWAVALQIGFVGCVREFPQEECKEKETVQVEVADLLPDSLASFEDLRMRSVNLIFYPVSGENPIKGSIVDTTGSISVPHGKYSLLIYSSDFFDLDGLFYRGIEQPETAEAYTHQHTRSDLVMQIEEPDPLFCFYTDDFDPENQKEEEENEADEQPVHVSVVLIPLVYTYRFKIRVEGLQNFRSATAIVTGMYTSVFLTNSCHREDEAAAMQVKMKKSTESASEGFIYGEFRSFGSHQRNDVNHHISIVFNNDETKIVELDDLTIPIKSIPHGGEIVIKQKIVIKDSDGGEEGAFDPKVYDWDDVVIPLPV